MNENEKEKNFIVCSICALLAIRHATVTNKRRHKITILMDSSYALLPSLSPAVNGQRYRFHKSPSSLLCS